MAKVLGLQCVRCHALFPENHFADDCPNCRAAAPSNLTVCYEESLRTTRQKPGTSADRGLWRYGDLLPVEQAEAVSLGEGDSPLHHLSALSKELRLPQLLAKDESRNPTWSFKDRLACLAVSVAKKRRARVIVSSSTGNAAAAAAAYSAKAGLPCVIFTVQGMTGPLLTQMCAYGATVIAVPNKADRWKLMTHAVREFNWFPTSPFFGPVVGSNPYGIEGYKTLAYEIAEQMNWQVPDYCVLPVCYGDALLGMWRGFEDMLAFGWTDRMPQMIAAEVYGSLGAALKDGGDVLKEMPKDHDTVSLSISATRSTFQSLDIIRRSGGTAVTSDDGATLQWQQKLSRQEGLYVEPASATTLVAVEVLRRSGRIRATDTVVVLLTASGLKDSHLTKYMDGAAQTPPSEIQAAVSDMRAKYGSSIQLVS